MSKIDLHVHTNISDGILSPKEIIDEAVKNNVKYLAISDHDTIDAYTDELINYAKENKITLIKGVEISSQDVVGVHVLGYNIDINNIELKNKLYELRNSRHIYLHEVSKLLKENGYIIHTDSLDKIEAVTKAHIAQDIVDNKDNEKILLDRFNHIPDRGEFIETIMNEGCICYVKRKSITPKDAVNLIKSAGGKAVLAHPVAYKYEDNLTIENVQKIVDDMNPDGIEANYYYVDRNNNKIDEINKWKEFAKKNNKFITIGSDFHKKDGLRPEIGFTNWNINISDEETKEIINNILN